MHKKTLWFVLALACGVALVSVSGNILRAILLILTIVFFLLYCCSGAWSRGGSVQHRYPYRPGVEFRLPNGRITTNGYAASHPGEFAHWANGPENVYGENIDRSDWENWRVNYYGM